MALGGGKQAVLDLTVPAVTAPGFFECLEGAIERKLTLGPLCERLQLSREHFVRVFTERMGMPPMRYYLGLKIEAARAMLSSTNLHISEISDKLGFGDQFAFARAFKRVSGLSPSQYRAMCLQRVDFTAESPGEPA